MENSAVSRTDPCSLKSIPQIAVLMETSRAFGRGIIQGIANYARTFGPWNLQVQPGDLPQRLTSHRHWPLDAVIGRIDQRSTLDIIKRRSLPAVSFDRNLRQFPTPVVMDTEPICRVAFAHLRDRGHQHFAYYDQHTWWGRERGEAFAQIVTAAGCQVHVYPTFGRRPIGLTELARWLRALPKPIGLFAGDDLAGRQIIDVCRYAGVAVPEDVAVVGVDNDELICGISYPTLSSVRINAERIGYEGAAVLHQLLAGRPPPGRTVEIDPLGVELRQSTDVMAISDPVVARAAVYIREHACDGIHIADVLKHTPVSRRKLETLFEKILGRSPHAEILQVRLNKAQALLVNTDIKIGSIAEAVGFPSGAYLHRAFCKHLHIKPSEFRAHHRRTGR